MTVQAYGAAITKAEHTIFLLPSESDQILIGQTEIKGRNCILINCRIPPAQKNIFLHSGNDKIALKIVTPTLLWGQQIFEEHPVDRFNQDKSREVIFTIHVLEEKGLRRKAYMLGNVNSEGLICWGGFQPANMRQAHLQFFNRYFNGAYSPGVFHKCPNSSNPINPKQPTCNTECQCCKSINLWQNNCGCPPWTSPAFHENYKTFITNFTGGSLPFPWENCDFDKLKNTLVGKKQEAFYLGSDNNKLVYGWAKETLQGWKIRIPNKAPFALKPAQVFIANIGKNYY